MESLHRRDFLRSCGAAAALVLTDVSCRAWVDQFNAISYRMSGFTAEQQRRLGKAMDMLAPRFQSDKIVNNTYKVCKKQFLANGAFKASNLERHPTYTEKDLLRFQIETLRLPNDAQDTEPPFPVVHLRAFYEESTVEGRARTNLVTVKYLGRRVVQSGSFNVEINSYMLDRINDVEEWASTVGHEMLHNLGHLHEVGDYTDNWAINVYHNAIVCNGNYPGEKARRFH